MILDFTGRWIAAISAALIGVPTFAVAEESASDLAATLDRPDGQRTKEERSTIILVQMQICSGENQILQLQNKSRVSNTSSDIVYQVLFPKERKGGAVLLHRSDEKFSGTTFAPLNTV